MPKYTEFPWEMDEDGIIASKERGILIASTYMTNRKANGDLITAAPELLDACKSILEDIKDQLVDCKSPGGRQTLEIQKGYLQEAINKAEGIG